MSFVQELRRRVQGSLPPLVFLSLVAYFCWNAVNGERGLKTYPARRDELRHAQAELARVEAERDGWERRVAGLRGNRIDPDTLDERARAMLNMADPNDIVVPYGQGKRLF